MFYEDYDKLNITLFAGEKINLTIRGNKRPDQNIDVVPNIKPAGDVAYVGSKWAWWNSTWGNRICLNGLNNTNSTNESRDLELFHINLTGVTGFNGCSNNTGVKCVDGRMVINDTGSNFREVLFNVSNATRFRTIGASGGIAEEGSTTLNLYFMLNTSAGRYNPGQYNVTPCFFFNNTNASISANHVGGIINELDSFETGINVAAGSTPFSSVSIGTFGTNTTAGWKPDGNVSAMPTGAATRDSLRDASGVSTNYMLYVYGLGNWQRGVGLTGNDEGTGIVGTCTNGRDGQDSACVTQNSTNGTGWHSIKMTTLESFTGTQIMLYVNGKFAALDPSSTLPVVHIGEEAAVVSANNLLDFFVGSSWNANMYDYPSNFTIGIVENVTNPVVPGNVFECINNTFAINTSSIEHQEQPSTFNMTWNVTNVTTRTATFFYNDVNYTGSQITEAITVNNTATNSSLFSVRVNTSIINTNASTTNAIWVVNCVLNNGTTRGVTTRNQSQTIGLAHREASFNFTTPVGEGSNNNYTINLSLFNTVSYANLSFYINSIVQTNATTTFSGPIAPTLNGSLYNITNQSTGLVTLNNTPQTLIFQQAIVYTNGSVKLVNSTTQNQSLIWSYIPKTVNISVQLIERTVVNITNNISIINNGNIANVVSIIEFNGTNYSSTTYTNISNEYSFLHRIFLPLVLVGRDYNTTAKGLFNITAVGTSVVRNSTTNQQARQVFLVYLGNCSAGFSNNQSLNYTIRDQSTFVAINPASLTVNYLVYYTNQSYNRTYNVSNTANTHAACISPDFANFTATRLAFASAPLYTSKTTFFGPFIADPVIEFVDLFLVNATGAGFSQVVVNVVDENDNPLINQLVTVERFDNITNYTLVDSKLTDFMGNAPFSLDTTLLYRINISENGIIRTQTSLLPASVGPFQILSTPLTFRILVGSGAGLSKLLSILNVQHNLTWSNSTRSFRLDFVDVQQVTDFVCLKVSYQNITGVYSLGSNCSTNKTDTIYFGVGSMLNGSFTAYATGHNPDPGEFLMDTLNIIYPGATLFGQEGYIWAIILTGTLAIIGAVVTGANPVGMVAGTLLGVALSGMIGLVVVGWGVYLGIVVVGIIMIYYFKT